MGRVFTERSFEKDERFLDYVKDNFGIDYDGSQTEYKDVEIEDIMVNIKIEDLDNFISLKMDKLVSLKAFLLSKEQGMDINLLVQKIDRIMNMSDNGLTRDKDGIVINSELERFFEIAGMKFYNNNIEDSKRVVEVVINEDKIDFNTVKETGN